MPKIILRQTRKMINVLKGDFNGEFDLSVQDQQGFYNDYTTGAIITNLSFAANPKLGSFATVRILGGLLAADAIPVTWDGYNDLTISQDPTKFNVIMIVYGNNTSNSDIRMTNTIIDAPDLVAPTFAVAPIATNIQETSFDITATLNENGTVYGYLLADGSPAPDTDTVIANAQQSFVDSGSGGTLSFTGLTVDTNYDVYVVAEDTAGNKQATPVLVEVLTVSQSVVEQISPQFLWHKLDIATTDADPVTLSTDSLTTTLYNLENVGTVNRAVQNSQECVRINSGSYLRTVSSNVSALFQNTFSINYEVKLDDGIPAALGFFLDIANTTNGRVRAFIRNTGVVNITYSSNGETRIAETLNPVFADGAMADFSTMSFQFPSNGSMKIFKDNVEQTLNGAFDGDLSTLDMSLFNSAARKLLVGYEDGGTRGINGWIRNFIIQPVDYTSQNRIDLAVL